MPETVGPSRGHLRSTLGISGGRIDRHINELPLNPGNHKTSAPQLPRTKRFEKWVWINTYRYIFINWNGMNIHKYQLFWGSLGTRVLTHPQMGNGWKCCESSGWTGNHHVTGEYSLVSSNVAGKLPSFLVDFPIVQAPFIVDVQLPCLMNGG